MSGTRAAGDYRELMSDRPLRRSFLVSLVGRFGYALLPLCLLFSIADASQSFGAAATATAAFGIGALAMPVQARVIDRKGQRRVLPLVGAWFVGFLTLVSVLASRGLDSPGVWVGLCFLGGLGAPALGPAMRAQWRQATTRDRRAGAYSLDAIAEEGLFLGGPLAASVVLAVGPAWWGVAATAVLVPVGVLGLVTSRHAPPARSAGTDVSRVRRLGPFHQPGFRRLVLLAGVSGLAMSAAFTVLAGQADQAGRPAVVGLVEAAAGIASVLGVLWWDRRRPAWPWSRQMAALLATRTLPVAVCIVHPTLWTVAVMLTISGIATAPTFVVAYAASDHEVDKGQHTEASTWVTSMNNIGVSVGTAMAGLLFVRTSPAVIFGVTAALLILAIATALQTQVREG